MHELPITQSIVRIAAEEAERHNIKKINEIRLKIGELSGLVPECIQQYFDFASKGTAAEGAKIIITKIPITMKCTSCDFCGEPSSFINNKCPVCNGARIIRAGGNEFYIDSMEVEDEDGD